VTHHPLWNAALTGLLVGWSVAVVFLIGHSLYLVLALPAGGFLSTLMGAGLLVGLLIGGVAEAVERRRDRLVGSSPPVGERSGL